MQHLTVGVLALQGAFHEHITLLRKAAAALQQSPSPSPSPSQPEELEFIEVRTTAELERCDGLIIPGGESTAIALVAARSGLLEGLREFVKVQRKPTWGTCAGLILLSESANRTKQGGQELIGGLDVRVNRNHFGRQVESFQAPIDLPFLKGVVDNDTQQVEGGKEGAPAAKPFPGVFIRAPVVEKLLPTTEGIQDTEQQRTDTVVAPSREMMTAAGEKVKADVEAGVKVMGMLPGRAERLDGKIEQSADQAGDIVAVRQGNVFGTSFHPELTEDMRIHLWWLRELISWKNSEGMNKHA